MGKFFEGLKSFFSALRDGLLTLMLLLLLLLPQWVNARLVKAGFVEGDIAGFKWKKEVEDNSAKLTTALATIDGVPPPRPPPPPARGAALVARAAPPPAAKVEALQQENAVVLRDSDLSAKAVTKRIRANANILKDLRL